MNLDKFFWACSVNCTVKLHRILGWHQGHWRTRFFLKVFIIAIHYLVFSLDSRTQSSKFNLIISIKSLSIIAFSNRFLKRESVLSAHLSSPRLLNVNLSAVVVKTDYEVRVFIRYRCYEALIYSRRLDIT